MMQELLTGKKQEQLPETMAERELKKEEEFEGILSSSDEDKPADTVQSIAKAELGLLRNQSKAQLYKKYEHEEAAQRDFGFTDENVNKFSHKVKMTTKEGELEEMKTISYTADVGRVSNADLRAISMQNLDIFGSPISEEDKKNASQSFQKTQKILADLI